MPHREVIAHRGAAAYSPENTMPAFELAVQQNAGCVEHDLQVTKDGVLVCLHDQTLERTTDVQHVFPTRGRDAHEAAGTVRRWFVRDFTLAEVQRLDAGSWFNPATAGARVPTFDQLLDWARSRVGVLTELKDIEAYETLGVDPLMLCDEALRRHGLTTPRGDSAVTVQSFHEPTVRRARRLLAGTIPVVLLVEPADAALLANSDQVTAIADFADGIGPGKSIVADHPTIVEWAHAAGLRVTPWTFRSSTIGTFENVGAEIHYYLNHLRVDAVITDHPDAFGRS